MTLPKTGTTFRHVKATNPESRWKVTRVYNDGRPMPIRYRIVGSDGNVAYGGLSRRCSEAAFERLAQDIQEPGKRPVRNAGVKLTDGAFWDLHHRAHAAGLAAGEASVPTPMIVQQHANPLDDNSPVIKEYAPVMDGVCGFAYVWVPGNSNFARWMRNNMIGHKGYPTGQELSVREFNQSMTRKGAYAAAYAAVIREAGVEGAYSYTRMD